MIEHKHLTSGPEFGKRNRQIFAFVSCYWESDSIQPCFVNTWTNTTCFMKMLFKMRSTTIVFTFQLNSLVIFSTFSFENTFGHVVSSFA